MGRSVGYIRNLPVGQQIKSVVTANNLLALVTHNSRLSSNFL